MQTGKNAKIKIAVLILLLAVLTVLLTEKLKEGYLPEEYSDTYVGVDEVREELSFTVYSEEEWEEWFGTYKREYLTEEMLGALLEKLGVSEQIAPPGMGARRPVSREAWSDIYGQIRDYLDMERVVKEQALLILGTMEAGQETVLITNQGDFYTALPISYFKEWTAYDVYMIEDRCIGLKGISEVETVIENAYLKASFNQTLTFLFAGMSYDKEAGELSEEFSPGVCDLIFTGGELCTIRKKQDVIQGELLSYDDTTIEIKDYGKIIHSGKVPVYQTYGEVVEKSISDVILGNMNVEYVTAGEEVCAILIREPAQITDIRVLLLSDEGTKFRSGVFLKCSTDADVSCGDTKHTAAAGEVISAEAYLRDAKGATCIVRPRTEDGKLYICDGEGNPVSNGYAGSMEVRSYDGEGYTLVNELPFETYLYAVVPSEMPSSYAAEALKVQAVCARSYAYRQLLRADLAAYGAHIDDSTSYQVYNKVPQTPESVAAVDATSGQVLTYGGEVVEAYYFSTSAGYTDTVEVWNTQEDSAYGYLQAVCLNQETYAGDLSKEEDFLAFIKQKPEGYDSGVKYYRWFASADYSGKTDEINAILENRHSISDRNVLYYEADGKTEAQNTAGMGEITGVSTEERSTSGAILTLRLDYENGVVRVKTEYNIRKVLGCMVQKMVYADSSESGDVSMLPSAFCAVEKQENGELLISGGGYGHGLGMSQNGANGMANSGMGYQEILNYFYHDISIETVTELEGKDQA